LNHHLDRKGIIVKITKEKAEENRAALVAAASKLFREKGIDGVGVAEISKAAGLTHGALYAHFDSKEALANAAFAWSMEHAKAKLYAATVDGEPDLEQFLAYYLSPQQRDNYGGHCAMAAAASEIGRQDLAFSKTFSESYMVTVRAFERRIAANRPGADAPQLAMALVASLIGAMSVSRATAKANPALSQQVLDGARLLVAETLGGPDEN
jgi:TetR/AcrR family transcriptional repressor of nem operon